MCILKLKIIHIEVQDFIHMMEVGKKLSILMVLVTEHQKMEILYM